MVLHVYIPRQHTNNFYFRTLVQLCLEMPGMPQCAQFAAMCEEAGDSFTTLCKADDNGMPVMKMYLHARMSGMYGMWHIYNIK